MKIAHHLFEILVFEFVQNLPFVGGFVVAWRLWQHGSWLMALWVICVSSLIGAVLINITEPKISPHFKEPLLVTFMNVMLMSLFMLLLILYFSSTQFTWYSDIGIGIGIGALLGSVQSLAAREPILPRHVIAFVVAFPVALICLRMMLTVLSAWVTVLSVTAVLTIIIAVLDYRHLLVDNVRV